ncbi:(deoxy)nucleoside triphosphate pyrophosphohydrolase [Mucilaginibacter lappiensis]|uniref:(deoxy)nucleoside triphosphate pyrophosphohydrolase n=1 Tax=Mucilaginibacter lappiensis TaxID=354630 RepID=UPI003D1E9FF7
MIKVTCALIINNEERILAAQRSNNMNLPLKWEFPGGKIEANETPEACLIREIKEELNIEIQIIKALPPNTHSYPNITIKLMPFICGHVKGDIILKEHADFKWLHKNELLALDWADADIPIVKYYLNLINASI